MTVFHRSEASDALTNAVGSGSNQSSSGKLSTPVVFGVCSIFAPIFQVLWVVGLLIFDESTRGKLLNNNPRTALEWIGNGIQMFWPIPAGLIAGFAAILVGNWRTGRIAGIIGLILNGCMIELVVWLIFRKP